MHKIKGQSPPGIESARTKVRDRNKLRVLKGHKKPSAAEGE